MKKLIIFLFIVPFLLCDCQNRKIISKKIKVYANNTLNALDCANNKIIIKQFEDYLNSGEIDYYNINSLSYWKTTEDFRYPNTTLTFIGYNSKSICEKKITVIALYRVKDNIYCMKVMLTSADKDFDKIDLSNICTLYVEEGENQAIKFLSSAQWYAENWNNKRMNTVTYYYAPSHRFDSSCAMKSDSFSREMAKLFDTEILSFKYFVCEDMIDAQKIMGYDFEWNQYISVKQGALCDPSNYSIFGGNGTEFYPHEVAHLYIHQYAANNGCAFHSWIDEGLAVLLGGARDHELDWHLIELKKYLNKNPQVKLDDIFQLGTVPNGTNLTEYMDSIGGLICKLVYEKKGKKGILELLKGGSTDDDFYRLLELNFNVKKQDLGKFIRVELNKM